MNIIIGIDFAISNAGGKYMKKLFILVTMAILSASQAVYATGNIQYLGTNFVATFATTPQVDYDGMAVPMISNEPTPYWEFPGAAAQYTITASEGATSDSLHVTFTPIVSGSGCDYDPQDAYYEGSDFSATAASVEHNTNCEGSCSSGCLVVTCDITFVSGFFPRSTDYFITIEQVREVYNRSFTFTSPQLNARTVFSTTSPDSDPAPGPTAPVPAAATTTTATTSDPMFTPAAPRQLPTLPPPGTTMGGSGETGGSPADYSVFADDGSCQLIAGAIANPFGFIILAMALIPLAWRRRK